MFPVTEAIGDDVHWCIAEWVVKGQPWSFRLCILEAVREGGLELKIHSKRPALPERVGFYGGLTPSCSKVLVFRHLVSRRHFARLALPISRLLPPGTQWSGERAL